jgi:hypothetical protein
MANEQFVEGTMADLERSVAAELRALGPRIESDLIDRISRPGGPHDHSAPGEAPKRITGQLAASIRHDVTENQDAPDSATLVLYSTSPVSTYLEYGTQHVAPRPHFAPVFEAWADEVVSRVGDAVFRAGPNAGF